MLLSSFCLSNEIHDVDRQAISQFKVFIDHNHQYDASTVQKTNTKDWQIMQQENLNLGYIKASIWVSFSVHNPSSKPVSKLLDITYPLLDHIEIYDISNTPSISVLLKSGDKHPFSQRNYSHPNFINALNLQPNEHQKILIKIKSNSPVQTEFLLWSHNAFQEHYRHQASIIFFYLGLILSSAAFNLLVFVYLKEKVYLAYSLYAASFAFFMTSQQAILFEYVFPLSPVLHNWSQLLLSNFSIMLTAVFTLLFLRIKTQSKSAWALILLASFPLILILASAQIGYQAAIKATVIGALFIIPSIFIVGIINSRKSNDGFLFITAWLCLFSGVCVFLTSKVGLIKFSPIIDHSILIGSALELLIFAAALARRIHSEKVTRIQAQQIIIEGSKQTAKLHEDIIYSTTHHSTTGLPNRNYFERWIDMHLRENKHVTLVLFHLSRLHEIDKTLGRDISNEALETFGLRLNSEVQSLSNIEIIESRELFYVATLSASTHGLIINDKMNESLLTELKALQENINNSLMIDNMEIDPYIHCAYACYPEHGRQAQVLLRHAGIALDSAHQHEHHIVQYTKEINPYNERRLKLMVELKRAIERNTLDLHYQPLVDTKTGKFVGTEALIRWPHDEYGLIMPDEFIHIAEKTGVIQSLSLWVLRTAVQHLKGWLSINPDFLLSVNISALNVQDKKFISALHILFEDRKKLAKNIILELTESEMMTDSQHGLDNLKALADIGFHIAIDDFGTGYSNLAYLTKLPASELKIDKAFVSNLEGEKQNQLLVATAIQMAHNLNLTVVAEGVESEQTREFLEKLGCDYCQGYHFSRPVPIRTFNTLYAENRQ